MATVIDTFVTEFALDPSKFTAGQQKLLESMAKTQEQGRAFGNAMELQGRKITEVFSSMQRGALGLLTTFFGGYALEHAINHIATLDASTGRLARTLGMSAADVSVWQGAIQQVGGSAESANASLAGLNQDMVRFTMTGQSQLATILRQPVFEGIRLHDAKGRLREALDVMSDISDRLQKSGMDPRQQAGLLSMIPGMNQDTINLIVSGRLRRALLDARAAGAVSPDAVRQAEQYQKNLANLERSATALGRILFNVLAPGLNAAAESMAKLLQSWTPGSAAANIAEQNTSHEEMTRRFGAPPKWLTRMLGLPDEWYEKDRARDAAKPSGVTSVKPSAGIPSPAMATLATQLQKDVPGIKQFTAFTDAYHALLGKGDPHSQGRAIDFTLTDPSTHAAVANQLRAQHPDAVIIDHYDPEIAKKYRSTAPHMHIQVNEAGAKRLAPVTPGAGAAARTSMNRGGDTINNSASEVHVGVVINAPGADSEEVGGNVADVIKRRMMAAQANTGF